MFGLVGSVLILAIVGVIGLGEEHIDFLIPSGVEGFAKESGLKLLIPVFAFAVCLFL
jgi:hypothetical protein